MSMNEERTPLVMTPQKKSSHKSRCLDCPCQQFQSDDAVTSAVESDARMEALIDWLSGGMLLEKEQDRSLSAPPKLCPNRLQASIVVLNAIRDACRPYLESSAPTPTSASVPSSTTSNVSSAPKNATKLLPNFNDTATYEDSFPSLSSMASAAPPTMLVGRKKNKGPKKSNSSQSQPSSLTPVVPTMLVGRKKSKGPKNQKQPTGGSHATTKNVQMSVAVPKAKKKIKPVTISLSATSASFPSGDAFPPLSNGHNTAKLDGNISSLPSQETSEMLMSKTAQPAVTKSIKMGEESNGGGARHVSTDAVQKDNNEPADGKSSSPNNLQKLKRLASIYSTILRTHLAPFLLLELHLLVRLLSLSDKKETSKTANGQTKLAFSDIFQLEQSCRDFASETLSSVEGIIVNMGHETIKMLVALSALQRMCPGLCMTLQHAIYAGNSALIFEADQKALGSNTNIPHLTLPFDHARDSRHNYKTVDLGRLFKEREELRDSFLYQLRAFQDVRGRLMEHEQAEKHIQSIREESREMLKSLSPGNTLWFVNFFCDLLIQIGLVPISETDSEVLRQIGDKKRLQKLHMRFTSKSGHANKSSRKLHLDQSGPSSNTNTPLPEQSFAGHQEFFSLFLRAGDSHKFNIQMKRRMAKIISEFSAVNETKGLCEQIAKTQMLAKFLGMLEFGPNWDLSTDNFDTDNMSYGYEDFTLPPLKVMECIEAAWTQRRLVVVIPWVVQFLGMMKWDDLSKKCQYYTNTFALLWSINHHCILYRIKSHSYYQTNMILLSFQLDTLFHDVVGLVPSQKLAMVLLPVQKSADTESTSLVAMDNLPLWFSKPFLFPTIPHLKDLFELLVNSAQNGGKLPLTSSAKKVRPNTVTNLGSMDSRFASRISFSVDNVASPWSSKRPGTPKNEGGIQERLVDSFFHQHKDLQQLCQMIVDQALKNFSKKASRECILPTFRSGATSFDEYFAKSQSMSQDDYANLLKELDSQACIEATNLMSIEFDRTIKGTLHLLAPPESQTKVVEVAASLTINHASKKGTHAIYSIIREEKKKLMDEFIRKEKKAKAGVPLTSTKRDHAQKASNFVQDSSNFCAMTALTDSLRAFHELNKSVGEKLECLKQEKAKVLDYMQRYFIGADSQTILEFELQIISMLKEFFSKPSHIYLLKAVIEVVDVLSLLGKLGYASPSNRMDLESLLCDSENMLTLMGVLNCVENTNTLDYETIGNFLFVLMDGSIVSHRALEKALLHLVELNDDAKVVSNIVLKKLVPSDDEAAHEAEGPIIMVRLRKRLLRHPNEK